MRSMKLFLFLGASWLSFLSPAVGFVPRIRQSRPCRRKILWFTNTYSSFQETAPLFGRSAENEQKSKSTTQASADESVENALKFVDEILLNEVSGMDRDAIMARIDHQHAQDCLASRKLAVEENDRPVSSVDYDWIQVEGHKMAIRSLQPVLNATDIAIIRKAAEQQWQNPSKGAQSRFTYQRPGNYEAHVSDLGPHVKAILNDALLNSIYPTIRQAFWDEPSSRLCVYDALIIRYNATQAMEVSQAVGGAGQPLHRDLGIVSVNIMLNSADEFEGGGTFFENQLRTDDNTPLTPTGIGHCLAHYSAERHAGASTNAGVRDIMVIFVTAEKDPPPALMRNAWLKQCREECTSDDIMESVLCRIMHQRLAVQAVPSDGEAFQYLGTALMDYAKLFVTKDISTKVSALEAAIQCLQHASLLTPCDARIFNNLGLTLGRLSKCSNRDLADSTVNAYQRGRTLLRQSRHAGCAVEDDFDLISLNYALYLSNQDRFRDAAEVLQVLADKKRDGIEHGRVIEDAYRLWKFCKKNR